MRETQRVRAVRSNPLQRKREILATAVYLSHRTGHLNITRDAVASECNVTSSLVARYFGTMANLKRAVFKEAVRLEILPVLVHCVADPCLNKYPSLRSATLKYIHKKL